jgi:hypothetical protein
MCKFCTTNFRERDRYVLPIKEHTPVSSTGINVDCISLTGDGYTVITFTNDKIFKEDGELERLVMAYTVNFDYCPFCGRKLED